MPHQSAVARPQASFKLPLSTTVPVSDACWMTLAHFVHTRWPMTNAIELLKEQHDEVNELFEEYETASTQRKQAIFREIADNLAAHATIEETIFYPAAYAKQTEELLTEAVEEHLGIKRLISDLLDMSPEHPNFDAKVKVLKEQVQHHVHEEEDELFKKVKKDLSAQELKTLGSRMQEVFDTEMDGYPSDKVPEQTGEAAPLR